MRHILEITLEKLACHDRSSSNDSRGVAQPGLNGLHHHMLRGLLCRCVQSWRLISPSLCFWSFNCATAQENAGLFSLSVETLINSTTVKIKISVLRCDTRFSCAAEAGSAASSSSLWLKVTSKNAECKSLRLAAMTDADLPTKVHDSPSRPRELSGICETNGAESVFFIPFLSVCAALTLTTQQGTHVMHHTVISDSEVEVITSGRRSPLFSPSLHPPNTAARCSYVSHRSGGWRQLISSLWHAMMERCAPKTPRLVPRPRAPAGLCRGGSASDAWRVYWSATVERQERRWRHFFILWDSSCGYNHMPPCLRSWHTTTWLYQDSSDVTSQFLQPFNRIHLKILHFTLNLAKWRSMFQLFHEHDPSIVTTGGCHSFITPHKWCLSDGFIMNPEHGETCLGCNQNTQWVTAWSSEYLHLESWGTSSYLPAGVILHGAEMNSRRCWSL